MKRPPNQIGWKVLVMKRISHPTPEHNDGKSSAAKTAKCQILAKARMQQGVNEIVLDEHCSLTTIRPPSPGCFDG